jgi:hypothetical protein
VIGAVDGLHASDFLLLCQPARHETGEHGSSCQYEDKPGGLHRQRASTADITMAAARGPVMKAAGRRAACSSGTMNAVSASMEHKATQRERSRNRTTGTADTVRAMARQVNRLRYP